MQDKNISVVEDDGSLYMYDGSAKRELSVAVSDVKRICTEHGVWYDDLLLKVGVELSKVYSKYFVEYSIGNKCGFEVLAACALNLYGIDVDDASTVVYTTANFGLTETDNDMILTVTGLQAGVVCRCAGAAIERLYKLKWTDTPVLSMMYALYCAGDSQSAPPSFDFSAPVPPAPPEASAVVLQNKPESPAIPIEKKPGLNIKYLSREEAKRPFYITEITGLDPRNEEEDHYMQMGAFAEILNNVGVEDTEFLSKVREYVREQYIKAPDVVKREVNDYGVLCWIIYKNSLPIEFTGTMHPEAVGLDIRSNRMLANLFNVDEKVFPGIINKQIELYRDNVSLLNNEYWLVVNLYKLACGENAVVSNDEFVIEDIMPRTADGVSASNSIPMSEFEELVRLAKVTPNQFEDTIRDYVEGKWMRSPAEVKYRVNDCAVLSYIIYRNSDTPGSFTQEEPEEVGMDLRSCSIVCQILNEDMDCLPGVIKEIVDKNFPGKADISTQAKMLYTIFKLAGTVLTLETNAPRREGDLSIDEILGRNGIVGPLYIRKDEIENMLSDSTMTFDQFVVCITQKLKEKYSVLPDTFTMSMSAKGLLMSLIYKNVKGKCPASQSDAYDGFGRIAECDQEAMDILLGVSSNEVSKVVRGFIVDLGLDKRGLSFESQLIVGFYSSEFSEDGGC